MYENAYKRLTLFPQKELLNGADKPRDIISFLSLYCFENVFVTY